VRQRRIEALGVAKCLDDGHLDIVAIIAVIGAVATIADIGLSRLEEFLGVADALDWRQLHFGLSIIVLGQAFDLLDIENGVVLHIVDLALGFFALVILLRAGNGICVNDERAFLALSDMGTQL
jgi:hypothetical protein